MTNSRTLPTLEQIEAMDPLTRRRFLTMLGGSAVALGAGPLLLSACGGSSSSSSGGSGSGKTVTVGYVSPETGPYAEFGQADAFAISAARQFWQNGVPRASGKATINIVVKDTQSNSNMAATVTQTLINDNNVDVVLATGTPDTTNPVADQCEANGVPCITSVAPWQPYFFGRKGDPTKGFQWTYHFFWGLEDVIASHEDMWSQVSNNKVMGGLWPNDPDGNAWGDPKQGFPPAVQSAGYKVVDPGRYQTGTTDFSTFIGKYKSADVQLLSGVPIPPDFITFWKQANQQGFKPKVASIGKAILFPSVIESLGNLGVGLTSEVWWTPRFPFSSSLTGQSSKQLGDAYTAATGKQWTQPLGYVHAIFEVLANALKRVDDPTNRTALRDAIKNTSVDTIVGHVSWQGGPVPNVAKTKTAGGQWRTGTTYKYELTVVSNKDFPEVSLEGQVQPLS